MPKPAAARTESVRKPLTKSSYFVPAVLALLIIAVITIALIIGDTKSKKHLQPANTFNTACGPYRHDGNVVVNGHIIYVEQTKTPAEFDKGLGGRPCIPEDQGMFFAFSKDGHYPFWMKGMKFPIDIVWITSGHSVAAIEVNESPSTYPDKFENKIPAQYVLELKANRTTELGIKLGTTVRF